MRYAGYVRLSDTYGIVPWREDWVMRAVDLILAAPYAAEDDWRSYEGVLSMINSLACAPWAMCYMGTRHDDFAGFFHMNPIRAGHSVYLHGYGEPKAWPDARAAIRWMVDQAFTGWKAESVRVELATVHTALRRILTSLGFQDAGIRKQTHLYGGKWYDGVNLYLPRDVWQANWKGAAYGRR